MQYRKTKAVRWMACVVLIAYYASVQSADPSLLDQYRALVKARMELAAERQALEREIAAETAASRKPITVAQMQNATIQLSLERTVPGQTPFTSIKQSGGGTGVAVGCSPSTDFPGKYVCYIVTAAHIVDSGMTSQTALVYQSGRQVAALPFEFIKVDKSKELALIRVYADAPLPVVPIAPPGYAIAPNQPVIAVGCGDGTRPTVYSTSRTCVARVEDFNAVLDGHRAAFQAVVTNQRPKLGDSGGPLYDANGRLLGILSFRPDNTGSPRPNDPEFQEGAYVHSAEIYDFIAKAKGVMIDGGYVVNGPKTK